jgi:hypothetical protein
MNINMPGMPLGQKIHSVVTEKGSVYTYLPSGKTQRFKKAEGRLYEPQDVLIYVPGFDWVVDNSPERQRKFFGENRVQYDQTLLSYVQSKGKKTYIVDSSGRKLKSNEEVTSKSGLVLLAFGDRNGVDFCIPVTGDPRIGFKTFDTRKYQERERTMRENHLGHRVIKINLP